VFVLTRYIRRRGVRVEAIDFNPDQPGFKTVYGKCHLCPNPDTDPGAWVELTRELSSKIGGKPVIIPSADQFVSAVAEHADALRDHYGFHDEGVAVQGSLATSCVRNCAWMRRLKALW
jgi:hypothetical protein